MQANDDDDGGLGDLLNSLSDGRGNLHFNSLPGLPEMGNFQMSPPSSEDVCAPRASSYGDLMAEITYNEVHYIKNSGTPQKEYTLSNLKKFQIDVSIAYASSRQPALGTRLRMKAALFFESKQPVPPDAEGKAHLLGATEVETRDIELPSPDGVRSGCIAVFRLQLGPNMLSHKKSNQRFRIRVAPEDGAIARANPDLIAFSEPLRSKTKLPHAAAAASPVPDYATFAGPLFPPLEASSPPFASPSAPSATAEAPAAGSLEVADASASPRGSLGDEATATGADADGASATGACATGGGADGEGGGAGEGGESAEEARGRSVEDDVQRLQELNELLAREQEGERELNAELQAKRDAQRQTMSAQRESMEELENENARLRAEVAEKRAQLLQQVSLNLELAEEVKRRA